MKTDAAARSDVDAHRSRSLHPAQRPHAARVHRPRLACAVRGAAHQLGAAYGTRLRLKASFDESRIASAGGKVVARTLKRCGMILADGGETALAADDDAFLQLSDSSLTWSGLLGPFDLFPLQVTDFEVVDYDTSTLTVGAGGCSGVDRAPLAAIAPQARRKQLRNRPLRRHR